MWVIRSRDMNGAMARKTNRHFGQFRHQRSLASRSLKAALQLVTTSSYRSIPAKSRAMCSSDSERSREKYGSVSPVCSARAARSSPSASTPLDHWWLIS